MRSCRNSLAGVNSLPLSRSPLPSSRFGSPWVDSKVHPLSWLPPHDQPPHISRSFSSIGLPVSGGRVAFSDHRRCRLQRQHSVVGRRVATPSPRAERTEDSDAQARVTDHHDDKERFFFYRRVSFCRVTGSLHATLLRLYCF